MQHTKGTAMKTIHYTIRDTSATTEYLDIEESSLNELLVEMMKLQSHMTERSISTHADNKMLLQWWNRSNKDLPYCGFYQRTNSPASFVAGLLNNLMFGNQKDLSMVQAEHLQAIFDTASDALAIVPRPFKLEKIQFRNQLFTFN